MQFRNFAENLLGSKVKIKVLKYLLSEATITSEREISRLIGLSPGAVNKTLKEFQNLNLINPMKVGNITTWRLNKESYAYKFYVSKLKDCGKDTENLFGSRVKIKLLEHIVSEEAVTSEQETAKIIGVSQGAINKTLKLFRQLFALIKPMKVNNTTALLLDKKSSAYINYLSKLTFEKPIKELISDIETLNSASAIKKAILFGSVAEGRELPESDIDLFIQVENEKGRKNIFSGLENLGIACLQRYGNKLNSHIFTSADMKNPKHKKFLENVMKGIRVIER